MSSDPISPIQRKQLADLHILQSSVLPDEFQWRGTQHEVEQWEDALNSLNDAQGQGGDDGGSNKTTRRITSLPALSASVSFSGNTAKIWLDLDLPTSPDKNPLLHLRLAEEDRGRVEEDQVATLSKEVESKLADAIKQAQEYPLFDVYTSMQDYLLTNPLDYLPAPDSSVPATNTPTSSSSSFILTPRSHVITLRRLIIWSHHLLSNIKRRQISSWCTSLRVWGLLKTGHPGYLCFEGLVEDVKEMETNIKGMQWAAILVRDEESWISDAHDEEGALLACPIAKDSVGYPVVVKAQERGERVRTTCEEIETMKEIVDRLRSAGLPESEVVDALGLRKKQQ